MPSLRTNGRIYRTRPTALGQGHIEHLGSKHDHTDGKGTHRAITIVNDHCYPKNVAKTAEPGTEHTRSNSNSFTNRRTLGGYSSFRASYMRTLYWYSLHTT